MWRGSFKKLVYDMELLQEENRTGIRERLGRLESDGIASRATFWRERRRLDKQLGSLVAQLQLELFGDWRFLLSAAWPQDSCLAHDLELAFFSWLKKEVQHGSLLEAAPRGARLYCLALLFAEAGHMKTGEVARVLAALAGPSDCRSDAAAVAAAADAAAASLQTERRKYAERGGKSDGAAELLALPPLLLYFDAALADLPLEACPCLQGRAVVRGVAPNMTIDAVRRFCTGEVPSAGYFVLDPFGGTAAASQGVRRLLDSAEDVVASKCDDCPVRGMQWHGDVGQPCPCPKKVLQMLTSEDVFLYMGHGEDARRLLPDFSQQQQRHSLLRATTLMLGCSSARSARPKPTGSAKGFDTSGDEKWGLPVELLLGGAPACVGALWDVLGGDLERLALALLEHWPKAAPSSNSGLLTALCAARQACELPFLTGAAVVCYGIPG